MRVGRLSVNAGYSYSKRTYWWVKGAAVHRDGHITHRFVSLGPPRRGRFLVLWWKVSK